MIIETTVSLVTILNWGKILGGILSLFSFIFGVFKVINWIKTKLTNIDTNVLLLKNSIDDQIGGLRNDVKEQTQTLANELREQRQDYRTFYSPLLMMQMQNSSTNNSNTLPVRAKRTPPKKKAQR